MSTKRDKRYRARILYYVPGGNGPRDTRSWSLTSGGHGGVPKPTGVELLVVDENSGDIVDLHGVPHRSVRVSGFRGLITLPNGSRFDLRAPTRRQCARAFALRAIRCAKQPLIAPKSFAVRLRKRRLNWQRAVRDGLANLDIAGDIAVVTPAISGGAGVTRFWVPAGNGNVSSTTNWSTTSGGASGASAPTTNDIARFDSNSGAGTVTFDISPEWGAVNCTGFTGTWAVGTKQVGINGDGTTAATGNVTFGAGMTITGTTCVLLWHSGDPGSGGTWTSNGKTWPGNVTLGGTQTCPVTLADASNVTGAVQHSSGVFNTAGKTCAWGSFSSANTNTRTLTFGSSSITVSGTGTPWTTNNSNGITVTANTATVTLSGASVSMSGTVGVNWNGTSFAFTGGGSMAMGGAAGVKNLSCVGIARGDQFKVPNITITGQLLLQGGDAATKRLIVLNQGSITVQNTITVNGTHGAHANVDFQDIAIAGSAGTLTGTSIGDCGGNTGITFDASLAMTNTRTTSFNFSDATAWSGGRSPLPQDDVTISGAMGGQTITVDLIRCGRNIDFSGVTGNASILYGGFGFIVANYGSLIFGPGVSCGAGNSANPSGRNGTFSLTPDSTGKVATGASLFLNAPGSTYRFTATSVLTSQIDVAQGTLDGNGQNITTATLNLGGSVPTVAAGINFSTGTWTLTGTGNVIDFSSISNATITPGTATIQLSDTTATAKTIIGNGYSFPTVRYRSTGSGALAITGSNTFAGLDLECTTARTVTLPAGGVQTVTTLTIQGASGQLLSFVSSTPGTATRIKLALGGTATNTFFTQSADVAIPFSASDVGTGAGTASLASKYTVGDAGSGAEGTQTLKASLLGTQAGAGVDAGANRARLTGSESVNFDVQIDSAHSWLSGYETPSGSDASRRTKPVQFPKSPAGTLEEPRRGSFIVDPARS